MAASASSSTALCLEEGQWALLSLSGGDKRIMQVKRGEKLTNGKMKVLMDPMIGAPFGANFRIEADGLKRDERTVEEMSGAIGDTFSDVVSAQAGASNAELTDERLGEAHAQKLGEGDIRRLKQKGLSGEEVIRTLAKNSSTFAGKTAFSQDKYLRKKAKKHMPFVSMLRPTPLTVCDLYMGKSPEKLSNLRRDSLALLLSLSNVQPGSRALVLDTTLGLLPAAVAQRLGGRGRVLHLCSKGKPQLEALHWLNLPPAQLDTVASVDLAQLLAAPPLATPPTPAEAAAAQAAAREAEAAEAEPAGAVPMDAAAVASAVAAEAGRADEPAAV